jgi:hypothetical protein
MEGYLGKKGHVIPSWHTRYFIFDAESRTVAYYHSASSAAREEQLKDSLTVTSVCDVPDRVNMRQHRFDFLCFNQAKGETILSVSCETAELKERWLSVVEAMVGQTDVTQHSRFREFAKASGHSKDEVEAVLAAARAAAAERRETSSAVALLRVTILAARGVATDASQLGLQCTVVPLDIDGKEIRTEKRKTRASHSHAWEAQPFLLGAATPEGLERASVLLIKLKAGGGEGGGEMKDFGSVHIPLKPLLQEGSPSFLRGATTLAHQLELRKGMAAVQGELHVRIAPAAPPAQEAMAAVAAEMMRGGLDIADRSMYLKLQRACFLGTDATGFLRGCPAVRAALEEALVAGPGDARGGGGGGGPRGGNGGVSEDEALAFGNCMLREGFFRSVPPGLPFANAYSPFYRFAAHDPAAGSAAAAGAMSPRASTGAGGGTAMPAVPRMDSTDRRGSSSMRGFSARLLGAHIPAIKPKAQTRMSIKEFEVITSCSAD